MSVCVCTHQVVCEKGLGVNGMTLTSLKEEGFKAVFIGIGEGHILENSFASWMCNIKFALWGFTSFNTSKTVLYEHCVSVCVLTATACSTVNVCKIAYRKS